MILGEKFESVKCKLSLFKIKLLYYEILKNLSMPHKIIQASKINHGNLTNVKHVITSEIAFCLGSDDHSFYHLLLLKSQQTTPQSALLAIVNIKQFVFIIFIIHQSVVAVSNINLTNL